MHTPCTHRNSVHRVVHIHIRWLWNVRWFRYHNICFLPPLRPAGWIKNVLAYCCSISVIAYNTEQWCNVFCNQVLIELHYRSFCRMEKFVALFIIFLLGNFCIWECSADSRDGVAVPFPLNTLLVCNVPNPNPEKSGEDDSVPEDIIRVQLQPPARQNLTVWTPKESG